MKKLCNEDFHTFTACCFGQESRSWLWLFNSSHSKGGDQTNCWR